MCKEAEVEAAYRQNERDQFVPESEYVYTEDEEAEDELYRRFESEPA